MVNCFDIMGGVGRGIAPEEAENVIEGATDPYPQHRQDDKFLVWGARSTGRLVQVVFLLDEDQAKQNKQSAARPLCGARRQTDQSRA